MSSSHFNYWQTIIHLNIQTLFCSFTHICVSVPLLYPWFSSLFLLHSSGLLLRTHPPSAVWVFTHFHPFSSSPSLSLPHTSALLTLHLSVHLFLPLFLPLAEACTHSTSLLQLFFLSLWHHLVAVSRVLDELHHVCSKFFHVIFARKIALRISKVI